MHCTYSSFLKKGTTWAEATSNREKIKPVALAVVELRLSEGIRQAGGRAVISRFFFNLKFCCNLSQVFFGHSEDTLGLVCTSPILPRHCEAGFWGNNFLPEKLEILHEP